MAAASGEAVRLGSAAERRVAVCSTRVIPGSRAISRANLAGSPAGRSSATPSAGILRTTRAGCRSSACRSAPSLAYETTVLPLDLASEALRLDPGMAAPVITKVAKTARPHRLTSRIQLSLNWRIQTNPH